MCGFTREVELTTLRTPVKASDQGAQKLEDALHVHTSMQFYLICSFANMLLGNQEKAVTESTGQVMELNKLCGKDHL